MLGMLLTTLPTENAGARDVAHASRRANDTSYTKDAPAPSSACLRATLELHLAGNGPPPWLRSDCSHVYAILLSDE